MTTGMTYEQLLDRIISDGIAAAQADYADRPHRLRGAVEGFEACRGRTPEQLVELWREAESRVMALRGDTATSVDDYWYNRCFQAEVEWCMNVISVGLPRPLLTHLPTCRAAVKYAEIVGVRGHEDPDGSTIAEPLS